MYPYFYPYYTSPPPTCMYCLQYMRPDMYREETPPTPEPAQKVKTGFTREEALRIGRELGIDWSKSRFDAEQFRVGLNTELEHGRRDPVTNVTNDNPLLTGKIALAHLNEFPDYYVRLSKMEEEAKAYWGTR